jgi:hypothetical protein
MSSFALDSGLPEFLACGLSVRGGFRLSGINSKGAGWDGAGLSGQPGTETGLESKPPPSDSSGFIPSSEHLTDVDRLRLSLGAPDAGNRRLVICLESIIRIRWTVWERENLHPLPPRFPLHYGNSPERCFIFHVTVSMLAGCESMDQRRKNEGTPGRETTHYSKIVRTFRAIVAPSTIVLASFDNELVRSLLWPNRVLMITIATGHPCNSLAVSRKNRRTDCSLGEIQKFQNQKYAMLEGKKAGIDTIFMGQVEIPPSCRG